MRLHCRARCQQDWVFDVSVHGQQHKDACRSVAKSSSLNKLCSSRSSSQADVAQGNKDGTTDCTVDSPFTDLEKHDPDNMDIFTVHEDTAQVMPPVVMSRRLTSGFSASSLRAPSTIRVGSRRSIGNMELDDPLGLATASILMATSTNPADPESFRDGLPFTQMFHAHKFSDPLLYRKRQPDSLAFWAIDIAIPAAVLALGILCSICTLMGVASEFAAQTTHGDMAASNGTDIIITSLQAAPPP
jgi:hypothetical protein